ncbi:pyridoxamine 5'-phosphate oxidase family protein [Abyssalbus ytuae]|uniref:Pyridoxamine 5'-phosphate oxidase family protein n=1 Tax=Abyssalbus ytuae TaxID=2926907 RepID=A0A9E6ZJI4_9FLAO|nr:pyridoxamine 5'-phosphate oxidase family protein [Abyssalbus ytuae]UOB16739.1 pyridoxamine 5'-phosphate oxidase family protein [Abyssalbus ytuae]
MGENNLKKKEGLEKIKEITGHTKTCMMLTNLNKIPLSANPMTTAEVDDEGNLWFFISKDHTNYKEISGDNRIQLVYANEGKNEYLSVYGIGILLVDKEKIDQLWSPYLEAWYDGKNDPNISLLKIWIEDAYYWDSKSNKLVTLLKMASAALSGDKKELTEKGKISL